MLALISVVPDPVRALPDDTLKSVVSVLPVWPGRPQGGTGRPPGVAPEGSGVVLRPGIVATAWHVVKPARRIDVRLWDGRVLPARLIAGDSATDIAVLEVNTDLKPFEIAADSQPQLAQPVCAIGNAYGLGLSVTCGVVSALNVSNAGFNPVEDFIQTDAAANPGSSGGALVDSQGRLVGMVSAIFASKSDTNIGINFAVSTELLLRVTKALVNDGKVRYPSPGWRLQRPGRSRLAALAAPVVADVSVGGPADRAGIRPGDAVLEIGSRRIGTPRDAVTALAIVNDPGIPLNVAIQREGQRRVVKLELENVRAAAEAEDVRESAGDCPHPRPVCRVRQAVFPVSSFDPVASATRIGPDKLVTNRHVVGDRQEAVVHTPHGPRRAKVIPSAYRGDLTLLQVEDLPAGGFVPKLEGSIPEGGRFYAIGADIARKVVRVFNPGRLIAKPADGAGLGRLHVKSRMQPGVSGGALVNEQGQLVGIAVGGGDGRYEAAPLKDIHALLRLRRDPAAVPTTNRLGTALSQCAANMDAFQGQASSGAERRTLFQACAAATNHGQLLKAGRLLARAGDFNGAIGLHGQAVQQVPNSINAIMSLLVSLQLAGRFADMTAHARRLMALAPDEPQALRFGIQSGVWGGAPELAEQAYRALLKVDPRQARAARMFIDNAPPAPVRR